MDYRLLIGFEEYLKQKYQSDPSKQGEEIDVSSFNIFSLYSSDFKEYIEKEYGDDYSSIFGVVGNNSELLGYNSMQENGLLEHSIFDEMISENLTEGDDLNAIIGSFQKYAEMFEEENISNDVSQNTDNFWANIQQSDTKNITEENNSFNFIDKLNIDFSDEEKSVIIGLFDNNNDGTLTSEEQEIAASMLKELSDDKTLKKEGIDVLRQYILESLEKGLSGDEIIKNIKALDGNSEELEVEDFKALAKLAVNGVLQDDIIDFIDEGIQTNEVMEAAGAGNPTTTSGGSKINAPASSQKNLNNMSVEDLENELETAKSNVQKAQSDYTAEVEKVDAELAKKLKEANENTSATKEELDTANNELNENENELSNLNSDLQSAKTKVSDINGEIASLESLKNQAGEEIDISSINEKIAQLKEEKEKIETETIPQLEEKIKETEEKIDELKAQTIPQLEEKLTQFETQVSEYEQEVASLAQTNPELKTMMDAYNKAVEYQKSVETTLETRKADREKAENSDKRSVDEGPKDYSGNDEIDYTNMPMTYTLGDQTYHCVGFEGYDTDGDGEIDFKPDSWEEVQRYFANAGLMNLGKYGTMQCHNYSNVMVDFVMGTVNEDLLEALIDETEDPTYGDNDTAGLYGTKREYNSRDCLQCKASNRDEERAIIENELQNGRPCIVSVPYTGGCHYAVAVGMADNGDILIWDSYNGSMEKLGMSSNNDKNKLHRNLATGNGVMVIVKGSSYQYATAGWINYWEDCVNQDPEHTIEVDKSHSKKKK